MLVPLAGGGQETLLSEVGFVLLPLFSTAEACALRLVCREFLAAVREQPWEDRGTAIKGSIAAWRACFPHACCANVQHRDVPYGPFERAALADADFVHFEGLRELYMGHCTGVTDAAFVHLRGIQVLDLSYCNQPTLTDAAFAHLAGIQRLSLWGCGQASITDAAFAHLRGIKLLNISGCRQLTDAAFVHLRGIRTLFMWYCSQPAITDAAFAHLGGTHTLVMQGCDQDTITSAIFAHLKDIHALDMALCSDVLVATGHSLGLPVDARAYNHRALHCSFLDPGADYPEDEEEDDEDDWDWNVEGGAGEGGMDEE